MAQAEDDFDWTTAVPVEDETSSALAATPFGARTQPQPTQGPVAYDDEFDWKTAQLNEPFDASTARPLTAQEEHSYYKGLDEASRDPARILTNAEHSSLYDWRQEQDNAVSRFFEGASDIPGNLAQIGVDAAKETAQNYGENYLLNRGAFYKRNIATGMEAGRKIGVQLLQLFDWGQNKAADIVERGRANDAKMREIAASVPKTGDARVDGDNVMAAIAKAREQGVFDETPFGPNKEEDYERYLRQNSYNRSHAGNITEAATGNGVVTFPNEQMSFMGQQPMQSVATGGAMIFDPVNALPVGAGIFSKLRILRRLSRATGMPLPAMERKLAGWADGIEDRGARVAAKVTEKTGLSKTQQLATVSTASATAGLLAANTEGMDGVLLPVAALASVPVLYKAVGGTIRKTSQAAGVGAQVVREMRAGNIGTMRQASAEDLLRTGAVPEPYAAFMRPYATGVESTLGRMAKNPSNSEITRKLSRLADNSGVTQAFRVADDALSSGVAATLASAPFALLAPDAEQAGAIVGGAATLGTFAGPVSGAFARRQGAVNADIARMLIDVHAVNGDVPALLSLGRDRLGQIAGMQGVVAGKTDFVTLRASDYRSNVDVRSAGSETAAGVFVEKASDGTARIFINVGEPVSMDGKVRVRDRGDGVREIRVRGEDGRTEFIAAPKNRRLLVNDGDTVRAGQQVVDYMPPTRSIPHEIAHAILTSDILDGDIRSDMRNYITQVYGEDGIQSRGREYIGKIVDGDIMFGTHEGQVILTPEEAADVRSGRRTMADVMKGKPVEAAERDALIEARIDEYNQRAREKGGNDWDWARDEVVAEQFASEAGGIDFRSVRRGGPKLMESALATSARVLEALGAKFDRSTGKPLDNPSVLFRDNPLFKSPVLRKRMVEHVRAYNDFLAGLEESGKREARGTRVSIDGTPDSAARSPHMKQRADNDNPEKRGQVGNEFLYIDETGKTQWRSPSEVRSRENARTSQAKTLYNPSRIVSPTSTEFGLRRTDSGRTVIGGPTLPPQFDSFIRFPKWFREFARTLEASRERGGTFIADYNAIGDGKDGTYTVRNRGDIRAILREVGFIGWEMTRNNHLKAVLIDLNAFRAATMKAINNGELGIFNNDMSVIEADLRAYLDNHKNGRPGETGIGQAKRDMLNGLIGTGTAVQRAANPLYSDLNPRGSVRSFRLDRFNDLTPTGREGLPFDYDKLNNNRMPSALPQAGMAMPDVPANLSTDQILRELEENQGYLGLSTLGMREGRPVKGGAQQTRELLKRNTALNEELRRRGGPQEESDVARVLRQRGQAMPDAADPIAAAAVRESDGKIFTGPLHTNAIEKAIAAGYKDGGYPKSDYGFVTKGGKFLSSEDAREYAIAQRQVTREGLDKWEAELGIDGTPGLESGAFALAKSEAKKFQKFDDNFSKAAVRGDLAAAEKINDQAAKELGLKPAVHATSAEPFSQFKIHPEGDVQHGFPAIFFSDSDMGYGRHRGAKGQRRVEKFYIRMERPLDLRKYKSNTDHPDYQKAWEQYSKVFEKAVEQGRVTQDSIVLGPLLDELPFDSLILHEAKGFSYAVLDPSQIVSAQPILQNADGSPMLPSQRFASALATKNTIARPATGRTRGQAMPDVADAPPFYLKSSQAIDAKVQGKAATPDQIKAILTNPQNGIKAEELKWTGVMQEVERLAKENSGKVPKEALLRYLAEDGAVRLEEVTLGQAARETRMRNQAREDLVNNGIANPTEAQITTQLEEFWPEHDDGGRDIGGTKYSQYQLPGGENYREVVLAMPNAALERAASNLRQFESQFGSRPIPAEMKPQHEALRQAVADAKRETAVYTSSHFDTPNYVAHMRLNERVDAKGKPGLFIEELQSDRHQQGREKGYNEDLDVARREELRKKTGTLTDAEMQELGELNSKALGRGIPDAPFRTSWPLQLFKRALRDAVADGKDWIGWTTGETQAARYDLSRQVDSISVSRGGGEAWEIWADKDGRQVFNNHDVSNIDQVAAVIGKDLAAKVADMKPGETARVFSGLDLKVGGEGMKGFYDTMVTKDVAKYVKQWGGQVEKQRMGKKPSKAFTDAVARFEEAKRKYGATSQQATEAMMAIPNESGGGGVAEYWRVNITPQMREGIKKAGQALFVGGTAAVVAEDQLEQ